ncbi:TTF-type domain-containing protein [Trichonephila clavata]|uniref:TTF-type domain-containing protein n=1 Tax=Trichonephila clavata TaxID=2740835 RepID=A0A8X6L7Y2_TRICU|nr:TTF-type domain-containing protein [Trichonephila clavata]
MNKAYNLFQLSFTRRTSTENLHDTSPRTSTGEIIAANNTPKKIVEEEEKVQIKDDNQADSNVQNGKHLGPEYQNDIGLWRNIIEDVRNFWCNRNSTECQHFESDFSVSCRQFDDCKRKFSLSMMF